MRYSIFAVMVAAAAVAGCGDDESTVPNPNSYKLIGPEEISVRQDSTVSLRTLGFAVVKNETDTVKGINANELPQQGLSYFPENIDIAFSNSLGIIRGVGPGSTRIKVKGYDQERIVNVTVRP